MTASGAY